MLKNIIKNAKVKLLCNKEKHKWEYSTWGSAPVDHLDGTFGLWSLGTRWCKTCGKEELNLKNGWEARKKGLTINDLE